MITLISTYYNDKPKDVLLSLQDNSKTTHMVPIKPGDYFELYSDKSFYINGVRCEETDFRV